MDINKIKSYIGFAIKSGQIIYGLDNIEVYRKKIHLILVSNTISDNSLEKIQKLANQRNLDILCLDDSIENITKRKNCKILAITNFELAKAIKNS